MAYTGRLGTSNSKLGNIELGIADSGGSGSFSADSILKAAILGSATANAVFLKTILGSASADAILRQVQSGSFTVNAVLFKTISDSFAADSVLKKAQFGSFAADAVFTALVTNSGSLTADAVLLRLQSDSLIANAILRRSQTSSITGDSVLKKTASSSLAADAIKSKSTSSSFTANAIKRITVSGSKTANAVLRKTTSRSFSADSYIIYNRMRHNRWTEHTGLDRDSDHILAQAFGVYLKDENMEAVIAELDARITAREQGYLHNLQHLYANAVVKSTRSGSLLANAAIIIRTLGSFTADAIKAGGILAKSFMVNPAVYISDSIAGAVDWGISTAVKGAFINTASLTSEAGDPEAFWGVTDKTGWAKFTLLSTQTVRVSTDYTGNDSVIQLFGPGSPVDGNRIDTADDTDTNPAGDDSLYYASESITVALGAGTYYVEVFPYDPTDTDFNIMLTMQITA